MIEKQIIGFHIEDSVITSIHKINELIEEVNRLKEELMLAQCYAKEAHTKLKDVTECHWALHQDFWRLHSMFSEYVEYHDS